MKTLVLLSSLFVVYGVNLNANEKNSLLDEYISKNKQQQFEYDYQKSDAEYSILRDSWIESVNLNYNYGKSNPFGVTQTSESATIKIDQPIFRSGGIYDAIKYAKHVRKYSDYSIDVAKRKLIKDAISILMQAKQKDLQITKQKLLIENSEINLKIKQQEYLSGRLDVGFLDNAVIERNVVIQSLYDIETAKEKLLSNLSALSDLDYESATVPELKIISQEEFLKDNLVLKVADSQISRDKYAKDVKVAKYLPKINFTAGYNWTKSDSIYQFGSPERDYHDYGIRATLPLNINTFRDIESSQVDYLKSKIVAEDKKVELSALFEQVMNNIKNIEKKKSLSLENKNIYTKLLNDTQKLFEAGYKTEFDVKTLKNSVEISEFNSKIYEMDKQLELLTLYEMYVNNE